jgi:hypothetical protein
MYLACRSVPEWPGSTISTLTCCTRPGCRAAAQHALLGAARRCHAPVCRVPLLLPKQHVQARPAGAPHLRAHAEEDEVVVVAALDLQPAAGRAEAAHAGLRQLPACTPRPKWRRVLHTLHAALPGPRQPSCANLPPQPAAQPPPTWLMRSPMLWGAVKSKGVPATVWMTPVGMSEALTGVKWSALRRTTCLRMLPLPWPARLKYEWPAMLTAWGAGRRGGEGAAASWDRGRLRLWGTTESSSLRPAAPAARGEGRTWRGLVRGGCDGDAQVIQVGQQLVAHSQLQRAGVALQAEGRQAGQISSRAGGDGWLAAGAEGAPAAAGGFRCSPAPAAAAALRSRAAPQAPRRHWRQAARRAPARTSSPSGLV